MPLSFTCPHCGSEIVEPDKAMGETTVCTHCQRETSVPSDPTRTNFIADDDVEVPLADPAKRSTVVKYFLIINIGVIAAIDLLFFFMILNPEPHTPFMYVGSFLLMSLCLVSTLGVWFRRKWGWYGLLSYMVISILLVVPSLSSEDLIQAVASLLIPSPLFAFFKSEWEHLK